MAWFKRLTHVPDDPNDPVINPAGWTVFAFFGGLWYLLDIARDLEKEDHTNGDWLVAMVASLGVIFILNFHKTMQKRRLARMLRDRPVPVIVGGPGIGFVTTTQEAASPRRFYVPAGSTIAFTALVYFGYNYLKPNQSSPNESLYVAVGAMLLFYIFIARPNERPPK